MNWLRDLISHMMGWETYDEACARISAEIERDYPRAKMLAESQRKADEAEARREAVRKRNDRGGEYERGMKGFQ